MADSALFELTDDNFKTAVAEGVWLVLFWDYTCGQCKRLAPLLEKAAAGFDGRARFGRLNLSDAPRTNDEMEIHFLPFTVIFRNGTKVIEIIGAKPVEQYIQAVEDALRA